MHILRISLLLVQSISCAKYQKTLVKALVQIDFPVYALSKHKQNPNLKANRGKMVNRGKMANFTNMSFCQKMLS